MKKKTLESYEIDAVLDAILFRYGYNFKNYSRSSVERRIEQRVRMSRLNHISDIIPKILHDKDFINEFLDDMSITVTDLFRDPAVFKAIRKRVIPKLRSYARLNTWHAGCATGEEAYSMAILLEEESLLKTTRIYATDFNNRSIAKAEKGIYHLDRIQQYTKNYLEAGGEKSFSDYYTTKYSYAKLNDALKKQITFANHNLTSDDVFAEMHIVLCRNVLIYFDRELQNIVLKLLANSLVPRGFLILGDKETLNFSTIKDDFEVVDSHLKIYRKKLFT